MKTHVSVYGEGQFDSGEGGANAPSYTPPKETLPGQ